METLLQSTRSAVGDIIAFLPNLIAGLIVLAIGWIIAAAIRSAIRALLPRAGFDNFLVRQKLTRQPAERHPGSNGVATAAFWVVMFIALMQTANLWNLGQIATGFGMALAYVPNLVAAVIIFGGAFILSNWVYERLRAAPTSEHLTATILPGAVRAGILTIAAFIALRQLMIAPEILTIGFTLVFGAIAVATALSFGLGGRHAAERLTTDWYENQQARRPHTNGAAAREPAPEELHH